MPRRLIGLDFETHYDSKYFTLRKMDIPSYICDPRFEATLVAVKEGANPAFIVDGPDIPRYLQGLGDPRDITLYGHNLMFDACIASWIYDWRAGLNICTLALARQTIQAYCRSLSLKSVLEYLNLPAKGGFLSAVDGMRRDDIIAAGLWQPYCDYAVGDIDGSYGIYQKLASLVPPEEHVIADMVLRMATEPSFDLDRPLLQAHLDDVIEKKEEMLAFAMIGGSLHGKEDLMSNDKFAQVLTSLGVDPPTKMSPVTGKQAWAFAKSDEGMKELQEHPDPAVQAVVAARLGHKTTLEETRTARFLNCSTLTFPAYGVGKFPVPLKVSGAHTHRLCLTGDTIIVCLRDSRVVHVRLDELEPADLVWDGEFFVQHGGLAYTGIKRVISYQGITGTPDHQVRSVECGYCRLEEAKARGYDIARGSVPDQARIDPTVQRPHPLQHENRVQLSSLRLRSTEPMERSVTSEGNSLPQLPYNRSDEGQEISAAYDRHERPLHAGQPAMGFEGTADAEPKLMATWDIVDCGPRNCFVANGRVVHNSGDWKYNAQNMRRGGKLRKSLKAPPGHTVVVGDEKQIEARIAAAFSGQSDLVEQFRRGVDVYAVMATKIFGFVVDRKIHVPQGFVGKTCILGGMFGIAAPKFRASVIHLSKEQTGTRIDVDVDLGPTVTSETIISAYRQETWAITEMRKRLNNCIPLMAQPDCNFFVGCVQFLHNKFKLPNGHYLYYNKLRYDQAAGSWIYEYAGRWKRIYGGALLENIIQALARIVAMHAALRLRPDILKYGWKLALQAHDELVLIVPDAHVAYAKQRLKEELTRQVTWMPNLPVDADIGSGPTYGDAK